MGKLKLILIFVGAIVLLRFLGQLMISKRNIAEHNRLKAEQDLINKQKNYVSKNEGKVTIVSKQKTPSGPFEDVDYEEVKK